MAFFARDEYTATASQTDFTVTFPYLEQSHVLVFVDGNLQTQGSGDDYIFAASTTIRFNVAMTGGETVVLVRSSSPSTRLVNYTGGSNLTADDLNTDSKQAFYMVQEAVDSANNALGTETTLQWDADNKRIINLAEPSAASDAATKSYVDNEVTTLGNVPGADNPGDDGKVLVASAGSWSWQTFAASVISGLGAFGETLIAAATAAAARTSLDVYSTSETDALLVPTGAVMPYAGSSAPTGWLLCDGSSKDSVTDTTLADLFTVIGTTYGGTGAAAFNLPDLRGRVVAGKDNMTSDAGRLTSGSAAGLDGDTLGAAGGAEQHQLTTSEMPSHTHTMDFIANANGGGAQWSGTGTGQTKATQSTGGDTAHTNVQPTIVLNYIIKK